MLTLRKTIQNGLVKSVFVEGCSIVLQSLRGHPPILIYQMGKVGSATIQESMLNARVRNKVYHIHFLSHEGIRSAENFFLGLRSPIIPGHLKQSKRLRRIIDVVTSVRWKVITLVRDPIAREISDMFQNVNRYHPELVGGGEVKKREILEFLQSELAEYNEADDYASTWFDRELKSVFGVDVFSEQFDTEKGYAILSGPKAEVLLLRVEDLSTNFNIGISRLLGLRKRIPMVKANVGSEKEYRDAYRYVLENITVPVEVCERIYSSKYSMHFYSENVRRQWIQRWSKGLCQIEETGTVG